MKKQWNSWTVLKKSWNFIFVLLWQPCSYYSYIIQFMYFSCCITFFSHLISPHIVQYFCFNYLTFLSYAFFSIHSTFALNLMHCSFCISYHSFHVSIYCIVCTALYVLHSMHRILYIISYASGSTHFALCIK